MAFNFIRAASSPNASSVGLSNLALSLGAAATIGRALFLLVQWNAPAEFAVSGVTDTGGNVWVPCGAKFNAGDNTWQQWFACRVTGIGTGSLEATVEWNSGVQFRIATLLEFSTDGNTLNFVGPVHSTGGSGAATSPTYTTTFADALVLSAVYGGVPMTSATMTAAGAQNQFQAAFYRSRPTAGPYTETVSPPGGGWAMLTIAFDTITGAGPAVAPTISAQPVSQSVSAGASATFSVTAAGTAPLSYQWKRGGVDIPAATGSSYTLTPTTLGDNGANFTVLVTNSAGSVTSAAAVLTVTAVPVTAPTISTQPVSQSVTAPASATFTVAAAGSAPLSYQWRRNSSTILGATSASYTTPATTVGDSGAVYSVIVSNVAGSVTSANALLTVAAAAPGPSPSPSPSPSPAPGPAPTSFSVTVEPPTPGANVFLLLTPGSDYPSASIQLPEGVDGQEILTHCTQAVAALFVLPAGGQSVSGAPASLPAPSWFRLRFDSLLNLWCRIG